MVSIIIPTYNRARWLRECVKSALAQDYPNLEVLVVDDGSTDETSEIVKGFEDVRLRYIRKRHTGAPGTRNYGILHTKGDLIVWLGSDDVLLPHTVEKEIAVFETFPGADVVYGDLLDINEEGRETGGVYSPRDYWGIDVIPYVIRGSRLPDGGAMFRRSLYEEHGLYNERFLRGHDYEFWSRIAERARFKHAGSFVCKRRIHSSQLSGNLTGRDVDLSYNIGVVERLVTRYPLPRLFPALFQGNSDLGTCRAYIALAGISLRWKDPRKAHSYVCKALSHLENVGWSARKLFSRDLAVFLYSSYITGSPHYLAESLAAVTRYPGSLAVWRCLAMAALPKASRDFVRRFSEEILGRRVCHRDPYAKS